jgi:hypothetical protein
MWRSGRGCWPLPHLAVAFLSDIGVAVDGCPAGRRAWRCRRVCATLPPSPVSAAAGACGCRCPQAASTVRASGPSLSGRHRPPRTRPQPLSARGGGHRGPPVADHPGTPADGGSGHRPPPADPARLSEVLCGTAASLAMPSGRLDGGRSAGVRSAAHLDVASRCCPPLGPEPPPVSGRRCPPRTLPPSTGVGCYRNRSPARRPLEGCRHRRYARAS